MISPELYLFISTSVETIIERPSDSSLSAAITTTMNESIFHQQLFEGLSGEPVNIKAMPNKDQLETNI